MAEPTPLTIQAGIPFSRRIRVVDGKNVWPLVGDFEVRAQLRRAKTSDSGLLSNLHEFMTKGYGTGGEANDITIDWSMTGAQTAALRQAALPKTDKAYVDVVLSDVGVDDARAVSIPLIVTVAPITTKAAGTA